MHNEPDEKIEQDDVFESISNDAERRGLTQDEVWEIWKKGLENHSILTEYNEQLNGEYWEDPIKY